MNFKKSQNITKALSALGMVVCVRNTNENSAAAHIENKSVANAHASTVVATALALPVKCLLAGFHLGGGGICPLLALACPPFRISFTCNQFKWLNV